jgi:crotonobetainyl-CoA:carnitine CoA-transferase CaiB-like acyl-CoA transferase
MPNRSDASLPPPRSILDRLWEDSGLPPEALAAVTLTGEEPVLPSSFRVDAAAQAAIAASALAAAEFFRQRGGARQEVAVDMRHAAAEFRSERHLSVDGAAPRELWDPIAGAYPCADGWVRLHTNFPHHRAGVVRLLGCGDDRDSVRAALAGWNAEAFEGRAAEEGLVVAAMRSFAAWDRHPQAHAVAVQPLVSVERIGDAPPELPRGADRPLAGIRVLDCTRIVAGPVASRALASHGADVLRVIGPDLPTIEALDIDTGRGKRSAFVDLRTETGRTVMRNLLRGADVFVQSYRPGALARQGLGPVEAARIRPGLVYVSLSAYGPGGPWADKRGFDSLVQTATGFNAAEAEAAGGAAPQPLPCQLLDHGSGFLMAFGALVALMCRAREGGSWHVRVSLARTGLWLRSLGRLPDGLAQPEPAASAVEPFLETSPSGYGVLRAVQPAARLSRTPTRYAAPSAPFGADAPEWLQRV